MHKLHNVHMHASSNASRAAAEGIGSTLFNFPILKLFILVVLSCHSLAMPSQVNAGMWHHAVVAADDSHGAVLSGAKC